MFPPHSFSQWPKQKYHLNFLVAASSWWSNSAAVPWLISHCCPPQPGWVTFRYISVQALHTSRLSLRQLPLPRHPSSHQPLPLTLYSATPSTQLNIQPKYHFLYKVFSWYDSIKYHLFVHCLTFWNHKMFQSHLVFSLLQPSNYLRSSGCFYWKMAFRSHDLGMMFVHCY